LAKAQAAVAALNERGRGKPRFTELPALQAAVEAILTRYRVLGGLAVRSTERVRECPLWCYGSRPAMVRVARDLGVKAVVARHAVATAIGRLGWRVYATNAPAAQLALSQAVLAYRSQYLVESDMGWLKGHPLSLTPRYLERNDHATDWMRLLSVEWRVLMRLEFVVRQRLAAARTVLAALYAGNPKRATARPTTECLLQRVEGLTLTIIREGRRQRYHLTPLSRVQRRILALVNFP
jgi:transposase